MNKLKSTAFVGILLHGGSYFFTQAVLLIVKLILVRFLIPEEFGLAAMAYIVVSSLGIINAFGTGLAFIRDNKSDPLRAKNTLFYLNGTAILLVAGLAFFSAPYATNFFSHRISDPESINTLMWMFRLIAVNFLLSLPTNIPAITLAKELRFKQQTIAGIVGTTIYGITAIVLALLGFGAWAIIIAQIASQIVSRAIVFFYAPFIPSLIFDKKIAKNYLSFGKNQFITSIIGVIVQNGDDTLLARLVGAAALGFYGLGAHFASIITAVTSGLIGNVIFPLFSKMQDNKELYARTFAKAFRLKILFVFPGIAGAVILVEDIVRLIFGENWLPIVPVFYILSISALLSNTVSLAYPVLNSLNKPHIIRNQKLIVFAFYIVLIYPLIKLWGMIGLSVAFVIFSIIGVIYYVPVLAREIPFFYSLSTKVLVKVIPTTLFMMAIVYGIKKIVPMNLFWLFALAFIGTIVYFVPMWFLDKELRWDVDEGWRILREKLRF